MKTLLKVENLTVGFPFRGGMLTICNHVSFELEKGGAYTLLGESGSGKSVLAQALIGLPPAPGIILSGSVFFDDIKFSALSEKQQRPYLGRRIGFLFQNAKTSLYPLHPIGRQIKAVLKLNQSHTSAALHEECMRLLSLMRFEDPSGIAEKYPHQLSGGMAQRAALAIALAGKPDLLIADEPTAALDVILKDEIIDLLNNLRETLSLSLFVITHDLDVAARLGGKTALFYAGQIVEEAPSQVFLNNPRHPYSIDLLKCFHGIENEPYSITGETPDFENLPTGCNYYGRCKRARPICEKTLPPENIHSSSERTLCHFSERLDE